MIPNPFVRLLARCTAIGAAFSISALATIAQGDVYVSASPQLIKVSPTGSKTTIPSTVVSPAGVATDASGNLYVADSLTNSIVKIGSDGSQTTVATGLNNPSDLLLDSEGNLYVANTGTNSIIKIGQNGQKTTVATGLHNPAGLAMDEMGNLYVSNDGNNTIAKIGTDGTQTTFASVGLNNPKGLTFDGKGNLLVANAGDNDIVKIGQDGTATADISTGLSAPQDVAIDGLGDLLVADAGSNSIKKVAPNGNVTTAASSLISPKYVALTSTIHELLNISTRGLVQTGQDVLIGGFIVKGDVSTASAGQTQTLIRAIGPSLTSAGVKDALSDPTVDLYDSTGRLIASNDNWKSSQQAAIQATGLAPKNDKESAILVNLADGSYTAIVRGANGAVGTALVEVYKIQ